MHHALSFPGACSTEGCCPFIQSRFSSEPKFLSIGPNHATAITADSQLYVAENSRAADVPDHSGQLLFLSFIWWPDTTSPAMPSPHSRETHHSFPTIP